MRYLILLCLMSVPSMLLASPAAVDLWQLQQEAASADPRVLHAQAVMRSGEGREREALGQLLPQISASASVNRSRRDDDLSRTEYNGKRVAMSVNQAIYDPQVWRSYQKFRQLTRQRDFEAEDTRIQASIDLAERYFAVLAAEDELELVRAELDATQRDSKRLYALLDHHMATTQDAQAMQARADNLVADEIEAANRVAVAREAISELVGRDVQEPLKRIAKHASYTLPAQSQAYWEQAALQENPGIKARERSLAAAQAAIAEAKAGHLPRLGVSLTALRSDIGYEGTLTPRSDNYVASVDMQMPLYSGGSTSARVASSMGDRDAAEQELEALRRQVKRETATAYLTMNAELQRIKASRVAVASTAAATQSSKEVFKRGITTSTDVLYNIREEFRARRDLQQAQYRFITSLLTLHRWRGQLTDNDIRRANDWLVEP
jgi:outer membrane protein